jgi:hypothetical protein
MASYALSSFWFIEQAIWLFGKQSIGWGSVFLLHKGFVIFLLRPGVFRPSVWQVFPNKLMLPLNSFVAHPLFRNEASNINNTLIRLDRMG